MSKITSFQVVDHGIEHEQYFQGCGVAFTEYDECVTGCGDNFAEALDDALESIAQDNIDVDALELEIHRDEDWMGEWPTTPSATSVFQKHNPEAYDEDSDEWDMDGCELYYYVSIRYSVEPQEVAK